MMQLLKNFMPGFFGSGVESRLTDKLPVDPEPLYAKSRQMTGLVGSLSPEQKARILGYKGPESFGCPSLPKLTRS
jgi:hypothetical protein